MDNEWYKGSVKQWNKHIRKLSSVFLTFLLKIDSNLKQYISTTISLLSTTSSSSLPPILLKSTSHPFPLQQKAGSKRLQSNRTKQNTIPHQGCTRQPNRRRRDSRAIFQILRDNDIVSKSTSTIGWVPKNALHTCFIIFPGKVLNRLQTQRHPF